MPITLKNNGEQLQVNYITNGLITANNGNLNKIDKISNDNLSNDLQTKLSNIETLQTNLNTTNSNITTLQTNLNSTNSNITTLQTNLSTLTTTVNNLPTQSSSNSGISLDNTVSSLNSISSTSLLNFAKEWRQCVNSGTTNMIDMCCSGDGRVALVCPWSGSAQLTKNYGETWSIPSGISSYIWSCSMNLDGSIIIISDNNNYFVSNDFGQSFTLPYPRPFQLQRSALSATGKYIVCGCGSGQGLQVSTDSGSTWVQKETTSWYWNDVAISLDGSVIYGASDAGLIKKSTDYGQNWSTIYTDSSSKAIKTMTCSGDGKYILVAFSSSSQLLLSTDFGSTFNLVGTSASYYKVAMSKNGIYMIAAVNGAGLYYSSNNGTNWSFLSNNQFCAISMSYNGELCYNVSPYNKPLISRVSHNLLNSAQPTIASIGSTYFDSDTNKLYIYNGTAWKSITLA